MKKSLILLIMLLTLYACGIFRGRIDLNQGGISQESYYETIPFEYIKDKIIVPVTINEEVRRFIFDTGAPAIISEGLQEEMEYKTFREEQIADINRNKESVAFVEANHLFLGDLEFNGIPAMVNSLEEVPWSCFKVDGFIGSNLIRNSVVQINKAEKQLIITDDINKLSHLGSQGEMELDRQSSPHIKLSISGEKARYVLFDSGSDDFVNVNGEYFEVLKKHRRDFDVERTGYGSGKMGMFGAGKKEKVYRLKLDSLNFDRTTIFDPLVEVSNTGNRLGVKVLNYGVVTLDYRKKKFYFSSPEETMTFEERKRPDLGFRPVIRRDTFQVGLVWENSLVDSLGLEPGNEIIRINQFNFRDSLEHSFCRIWLNDILQGKEVFDIRYIDEKGNFRRIKMRRKEE